MLTVSAQIRTHQIINLMHNQILILLLLLYFTRIFILSHTPDMYIIAYTRYYYPCNPGYLHSFLPRIFILPPTCYTLSYPGYLYVLLPRIFTLFSTPDIYTPGYLHYTLSYPGYLYSLLPRIFILSPTPDIYTLSYLGYLYSLLPRIFIFPPKAARRI